MDDPTSSQAGLSTTHQSANNYIVSAQKPTVINAAVVGNFRNGDELDMVISKVNRLEHLLVTAEGLKPHREIPIFGRIASLVAFRLPGESLDTILVLTCKYDLAILNFEPNGEIKTRASGHVADRVGRPAETGIIACVHASGLIALRLYEGHLKLIQWQDGRDLKCFNVRFEDHNVTDVAFLENTEKPAIAYFYQDQHGKHLKICEIDLEEKEMLPPTWRQGNIEAEATLLIPIPAPYGGLVVVGQESISYQKSASQYTSISPPLIHMSAFNCYSKIDKTGERFLLGDVSGRLFMLLLVKDKESGREEIKDLKIELLGNISSPECLVYLDNSAFVGSRFGDSQLVRLSTEPVDEESNSFVYVIDTYNNLGPIRDMVIINNEGQNQVITCSGAYKDGSLRIIRSGIGIDTLASVELAGIKGLFTLKLLSEHDRYLVVSFADITHLFLLDGEEMEDTQLPDFELAQSTLYAGNISSNRILQITGDGSFRVGWQSSSRITLCSVNPHSGQIILGSGEQITYLLVEHDQIRVAGQIACRNEVACLDISPIAERTPSKMFAVGFWNDQSVALYSVDPQIQLISEEKITGEVLPRSLLLIAMEGVIYLLVALGDGSVYYFRINQETGSLTEQKKVTLGSQPTLLRKFASKGATNVFACSDRPTVIYSSSKKLAFSNVNMKIVNQVAELNSDYYKDCLVMSDGENMIIGTIDDIQKLHIRTIPLGESVSRIAYQPETNTIAILTSRTEFILSTGQRTSTRESVSTLCTSKTTQMQTDKGAARGGGGSSHMDDMEGQQQQSEVDVCSLCILDANSFECLYVYELMRMEEGLSLCSATLSEDAVPYYGVGTSFVYGEDSESKQGRILIFQVQNNANSGETGRLRLVAEKEVKGAVYSITTLTNKLICSINTSVRLFEWTAEKELRLECSHFNYITALYVKTKGDLVLVGDLMKSVCLLSYKQIDSSFEEIARDYSVEWMSACEIIDSDTFLGGENSFNIFCAQKDMNAETDEEKMRLKQVGLFYLGEMINVFRRGTILSNQPDQSTPPIYSNPVLHGTTDGGLGVIVQLPDNIFAFLQELQKRVAVNVHNCMRVEHNSYRAFFTDKRLEQAKGFIDGDLVETIADMPREKVKVIIEGMKLPSDASKQRQPATVADVLKLIEDLSRIH